MSYANMLNLCSCIAVAACVTLAEATTTQTQEAARSSDNDFVTQPDSGSTRLKQPESPYPRIFVVDDLPERYTRGVLGGPEDNNKQYGLSAMGPLLSARLEHWASEWHAVDTWCHNQIRTSFLRTYNAEAADIIYVPTTFHVHDGQNMTQFVEEAATLLPYLGLKPHLVVLSHPAVWYVDKSQLLTHPISSSFIWVSCMQHDLDYTHDLSNVIGTPYFTRNHWSLGSPQLSPEGRHFNAAEVLATKAMFATESFLVRACIDACGDRGLLYEQCISRPDRCTFTEWAGEAGAVAQFERYKAAWYNLHPKGDSRSRTAMFDTWLAGSIPVVTFGNVSDFLPYADLLDYDRLLVQVPQHVMTGAESQNIIDFLWEGFNQADALEMMKHIHKLRHVFQFMQNPRHELLKWNLRNTLQVDDDAFTFTFKAIFRKICNDGIFLSHLCKSSDVRK